jgi:hypothetical protein
MILPTGNKLRVKIPQVCLRAREQAKIIDILGTGNREKQTGFSNLRMTPYMLARLAVS